MIGRLPYVLVACGLVGCVFLDVAEQHEIFERGVRMRGTLDGPTPESGPLVAVLLRHPGSGAEPEIVDHAVLAKAGGFVFSGVRPGTYSIPAFVDLNENLHFDPDEPAIDSTETNTFELTAGAVREGIALQIGAGDRIPAQESSDIRALQARSVGDQVATTMGQLRVLGEVIDLADPRLGRKNGDLGLWRPYDFLLEVGAGVYFLEPYDPGRIPVLFVHGVGGIPQDFRYLIERLDRSRFQPWLYYYPSGAPLGRIGEHLSQTMAQLQLEHRVERFFVVAHSMGGLVARSALLHHSEEVGSQAAQLFVTLSTPWNGVSSAKLGVEHAPVVVYSWIDVAPGSDFLHGLYYRAGEARRRLPDRLPHHLLFGFHRGDALSGTCTDDVVSVASELREEAQDESASIFGYEATHVGILNREDAAAHVNRILAAAD